VTIACPKSIEPTIAGFGATLMTDGLPETEAGSIAAAACDQIGRLLDGKAAVVIGPGLSLDPETALFIRRLTTECRLPLVLEGDAVAAYVGHCDDLRDRTDAGSCRVLLADPVEAARLLGTPFDAVQADRLEAARFIARASATCAVLKGKQTVVAGASGEAWINMTGHLALTKAGSSDVLAGMIGAALARNAQRPAEPAEIGHQRLDDRFLQDISVVAALHLHGLAADIACDALHENTVLATDLIEALAAAFRECDRQVERGLFSSQG
jgi:NAD(P)H-hydrate repair Nnr-like enzyme with NAD(P)H-hydrate dehydratase domain